MDKFFWRFDYDHYFQPEEGFSLRSELINSCLTLHLENLKLRNWCFYCVKNN